MLLNLSAIPLGPCYPVSKAHDSPILVLAHLVLKGVTSAMVSSFPSDITLPQGIVKQSQVLMRILVNVFQSDMHHSVAEADPCLRGNLREDKAHFAAELARQDYADHRSPRRPAIRLDEKDEGFEKPQVCS